MFGRKTNQIRKYNNMNILVIADCHHHINTQLKLKNITNIIGVYRCALIRIPDLEKNIIF